MKNNELQINYASIESRIRNQFIISDDEEIEIKFLYDLDDNYYFNAVWFCEDFKHQCDLILPPSAIF